jgi:hypothetical protein
MYQALLASPHAIISGPTKADNLDELVKVIERYVNAVNRFKKLELTNEHKLALGDHVLIKKMIDQGGAIQFLDHNISIYLMKIS